MPVTRMPRVPRHKMSGPVSSEDPRWLGYLEAQPEATPFHHPAWSRALAQTYRFRPLVFLQTDASGAVVAGMPLLEVPGPMRRSRLMSLPFTDSCPPLATDVGGLRELTGNLLRWRREARAGQLIVHGALAPQPDVRVVTRAVRHVLPLAASGDEVLGRLKGSPLPRAIRKAQREGVEATVSRAREDLELFYRLHLQTRRRLGVPVQPRRFLERIWTHLINQGLGFLVLATYQSQPIAAALFLAWNGNVIYKFGASDRRHWELRPNNLVMWTAIDWACRRGYRQLDFGRSELDNEGLRDFKRRWGAMELPLRYSYVAARPPRSTSPVTKRALAALIQTSPPAVCRALGELLYGRVMSFA